MTENEALARLKNMLAWDQDPTLNNAQINDLLLISRRADLAGATPMNVDTTADWADATLYAAGTVVQQPSAQRWWRAIQSGTSAALAPSWPAIVTPQVTGSLIYDGTVVWEDAGGTWRATWLLEAGAAEGWRWKAAQASSRFGFTADGQQLNRSEVIAHCLDMAARYERRCNAAPQTSTRVDDPYLLPRA